MSTIEADQTLPDLELVSQPATTIDYMARRSELRLTLKARYPVRNPVTGAQEGYSQGIAAGFREGLLRLPKKGPVTVLDTLDGGEYRFEDVTELHTTLQRHRLFGDRAEGFWVVEQPAPPVSREELDRLLDAASRWDDATLTAMLEQERSGWGREDVIRVAEGSLERIAAMRAKADETAREAEALYEEEKAKREQLEATVAAAKKAQEAAEKKLAAKGEAK